MKRAVLFSLLLSLITSFCAVAGEFKVAVINMEKIFQEYYKTKVIDANLKKQSEVYRDYATKLNNSKLKLKEEYNKLRDAFLNVALSESERESKRLEAKEKYRQLQLKDAEIQEYNKEKQRELRSEYEKMREKLLKEIRKVVIRYSVIKGYSLVVDMSGKTLNNIPAVIHYNASIDITSVVLQELNMGHTVGTTQEKVSNKKTDK